MSSKDQLKAQWMKGKPPVVVSDDDWLGMLDVVQEIARGAQPPIRSGFQGTRPTPSTHDPRVDALVKQVAELQAQLAEVQQQLEKKPKK